MKMTLSQMDELEAKLAVYCKMIDDINVDETDTKSIKNAFNELINLILEAIEMINDYEKELIIKAIKEKLDL